jgi:DNA repair exonuclease SbcCD ATPase subunit
MTDQDTQTPPWGDDFDAAKAWTLVQNLRADKAALQGEVATLKTDLTTAQSTAQAAETAKAEIETKYTELSAEVQRKEDEAKAKSEHDALVKKVLEKYEVDEARLEFLTGSTEEEIEEKAKRLGSVKGEKKEAEIDPITRRPVLALTPGQGGEQTPAFDPAAIAKQARAAAH